MKFLKTVFITFILCGFAQGLTPVALAASATEITTRFAIEKMNCALCPITVRKSMENVSGVSQVDVDYEMKIATVIFDPALTNKSQIAAASTNIGYPAAALTDKAE